MLVSNVTPHHTRHMPLSKLYNFTPKEVIRYCDHPDCNNVGEYKAPQSPDDLSNYFWFCLEHVRLYNKAWNYFEGMSPSEIEKYQKSSITWHRPTWPFGGKQSNDMLSEQLSASDPFFTIADELGAFGIDNSNDKIQHEKRSKPVTREQRQALSQLNLDSDADLQKIKDRYKELVKKFHPDANGGSRKAEDRLKAVNQAYGCLLSSGYAEGSRRL